MTKKINAPRCGLGDSSLPSGGPTDDAARSTNKTVDKSVSHLDRNRRYIPRKTQEPSKIFVPLSLNEMPHPTGRGMPLHTDPFAADRDHVTYRRSKVKIQTPRGAPRTDRRHSKPVPTVEHPVKPSDFICSNGVRHTSPKRVPPAKHATTMNDDQPFKNFLTNRRFTHSPERGKTAPNSCAQSTVCPPSALQPAALTDAAQLSVGRSSVLSGSTQHLRISNVFNDPVNMEPSPAHRSTLRISQVHRKAITMEGVFSPMRNGRVPKPMSVAPWAQESRPVITGKGHNHSRSLATSQTPFAIEA